MKLELDNLMGEFRKAKDSISKGALVLLTALSVVSLSQVQAFAAADKQALTLVPNTPPVLFWPAQGGKGQTVVLCLHELGMHAGIFDDLASRLAQKGMDVYSLDLRGFGGWQKIAGKESRMDIVRSLKDVKDHLLALKNERYKDKPGTKIFLLGEAMGGAIALEAQSLFPELIDGTISSNPGGEHFKTLRNYSKVGGHFIAHANKDFGMAKSLIQEATPRAEVRQFIENDPGVRLDLTARELMSCQFYMYKTRRFARAIKEDPVLIVQGLKDGESKPIGAERVYKSLATKDKKFIEVAEGDHYVYEDKQVNDKVFADTVSWLAEHGGATM
ncbi:MAG: alpha/beta hydrolase [Candidatus Melainabacteria bacterium]|nr:alpha/beta hydrolase [Candidatus Melainabacteria bacterium]